MPEDKKVRIGIETTADPKGITQTQADLRNLTSSIDGAQSSVDELERELQQAEAVLNRSGAGSNKFKKLRAEIARAKQELATLRVGELDARGLERLNQRLDRLRSRAQQARTSLERPPNTSWATEASNKFRELANSIPGGSKVTALLGSITKGGGPAVAAIGAVTAAVAGLIGITRQGLGKIAVIEDLEASFTTLLGSVELAQAKIASIRQIAAETPISVGDLATVARQLNGVAIAGKSAEDVLRLVGDAATVAQRPNVSLGQSAQELAVHYRRVVGAFKSGAGEIGESTNRFRELNVVQSEVVEQLREMHKQGGRGEEAIELLNRSLGRFEGEMVRRSGTISGAVNNLGDAWDSVSVAFAKPFSNTYKSFLQNTTQSLNSFAGQVETFTNKIAQYFGAQSLSSQRASVDIVQAMAEAADSVGTVADAASAGTAAAKASLSELTDSFDGAADAAKNLLTQQDKLAAAELQIELADIAASDLNEVEKSRASAEARIRAANEKSNREIEVARAGIARENQALQDLRDEIANLASASDKASADLQNLGEAPRAEAQDYKTQLRDAKLELERLQEVLEKSDSSPGFNLTSEEQDEINQKIEAQSTAIQNIARLYKTSKREIEAYAEEERRLSNIVSSSSSNINALSDALKEREALASVNIKALEDEINFTERLTKAQEVAATKQANNKVRDLAKRDVEAKGKAEVDDLEKALKKSENSQATQAKEIIKSLDGLKEIALSKFHPSIQEAIDGVQGGDLTRALKIATSAAESTTQDEANEGGKALQGLLAQYQSTAAEIDRSRVRIQAAQTALARGISDASQVKIEVPDVRAEPVEQRVVQKLDSELPKPKAALRKVTDELVKEAPAPKDVQRGVSDIIRAFAASPEPVERRVDDVSGDQVEPPQKTIQLVQRIVDQLADPEAVSQEIRRIATEFDLPSNVQQVVDRVLGQTPGEPEATTQKVERQIVGTLEAPEPVTQAVDRKVIDLGSRLTPSDEASNDVPARILTENQRSSNDERESPIAQQFATPAQQPVVIEEAKLTAPSAAEQGPRDAIDVEPVVSATQDNGRELEAGLSRVVTAQRTGTQQVASAIDATAIAVIDATDTIVTKLTDVQEKLSTLESQVKNAR